MYIITTIDYFTRFFVAQVIPDKRASTVKKVVEEWRGLSYIPETLITDNGKEFQNAEFREMLASLGIEHRLVGVEDYRTNGRVERVIRTIRDGVIKTGEMGLKEKIELIAERYNNIYHMGI